MIESLKRDIKCKINFYVYFFFLDISNPKSEYESSKVEQWFDKVDKHSPVILNHISHALKAMINKPKNGKTCLFT